MSRTGNRKGPYSTFKNAVDIHNADLHIAVANDYFERHDSTVASVLTVAIVAGDISFTVASAVGFTVGSPVHIGDLPNATEPVHPVITLIVGNVISVDRPLDYDYPIGTAITRSITDLRSLSGTLAAPVVYRYYPHINTVEHVKRIIISMVHGTAGDDSRFGDLSALTNGVVFRGIVAGETHTFTNWKANRDIILDMFDLVYTDKAGSGSHGTSARGAFSELDVAIHLDPARGDYLEMLVQDNLTALTSFRIKAQGHIEGV